MTYPVAIYSFANKSHFKLWEDVPIDGDGIYPDREKSKRKFIDEFGNGILIKKNDKYYIVTNFHIICKNDIFISQINILENKISILSKLINTFPEFDLAIMEVTDISFYDIDLTIKPYNNEKINYYVEKFNKTLDISILDKYSLSLDNLNDNYSLEMNDDDTILNKNKSNFVNISYNTNNKTNKIEFVSDAYKFKEYDLNFGFTKMTPQFPIYNFSLNSNDNFLNMCGKSGSGMFFDKTCIGLFYKVNPIDREVMIIPSCIIKKIMNHDDIKGFNTKIITGNIQNISYQLENNPKYTQHGHILYELICDSAIKLTNNNNQIIESDFMDDFKNKKKEYIISSINGLKFNNFHKIYNSEYNLHMSFQSDILIKSLDDINQFIFTMIDPNTEKEFNVNINSCNFYDKLKIPITIEDKKFFVFKGMIFTELSEEIYQYICMNDQMYNVSQSIHFAIQKPFNHKFENIYILIDYMKNDKVIQLMKNKKLISSNKLNCSILYKFNNKIFDPDNININKNNNVSLLTNNDIATSAQTFINFSL